MAAHAERAPPTVGKNPGTGKGTGEGKTEPEGEEEGGTGRVKYVF